MKPIVGIFAASAQAAQAAVALLPIGVSRDRISLVSPGASRQELASLPTTEGEQPGIGRALGAVVGGAAGASAGVQLAAATAATMFLPVVGPVIVTGLIAGAAVGLGAGVAIGSAMEDTLTEGMPKDELYLYEDALRQGKTVLVALAEGQTQAEAARAILERAGAESVDAARESWWIGLREPEQARYTAAGGDFLRDEATYRRGFLTALARDFRGNSYEGTIELLQQRYPEVYADEAFRHGFEGGQAYYRKLLETFQS
jgi:hypothetical protein